MGSASPDKSFEVKDGSDHGQLSHRVSAEHQATGRTASGGAGLPLAAGIWKGLRPLSALLEPTW